MWWATDLHAYVRMYVHTYMCMRACVHTCVYMNGLWLCKTVVVSGDKERGDYWHQAVCQPQPLVPGCEHLHSETESLCLSCGLLPHPQ